MKSQQVRHEQTKGDKNKKIKHQKQKEGRTSKGKICIYLWQKTKHIAGNRGKTKTCKKKKQQMERGKRNPDEKVKPEHRIFMYKA